MTEKMKPGATSQRVVVGVDDTPSGLAALSWAVGQASRSGAELVAVRAWQLGLPRHGSRRRQRARWPHPRIVLDFDGTGQRNAAAELVRRSLRLATGSARRGSGVVVVTPEGEPGAVLSGIASRPGDVLVVGHDPAPSIKRVVHGSVSGYCLAHAPCPVYVVPPGKGSVTGPSALAG
jgi:nucleotide-binding universal stress UspA family protein